MTVGEFCKSCHISFKFQHIFQVRRIDAKGVAKVIYHGFDCNHNNDDFRKIANADIRSWSIDFVNRAVLVNVK